MKKALSFIIAVIMLMQLFAFAVSAAAPARVYWSDEMPGEIKFTMVSGVKKYRLNLYKNNAKVCSTTHSFGEWENDEGHHNFLDEICENGSGTYRVEVGADGSSEFTSSGNYVYNKPSKTLAKPSNVVYNKNRQYVTWNEVDGAAFYELWFCYSIDGENFVNMSGWEIDPQWEGCFVDLQYDMEYIEEEYQWAAEDEGVDVDDLIRAIQIIAYPRNLNDANLSYSDYVTFDGTIVETPDEEEPTELGNLQWGNEIGVIKFMPASDKEGYYIKLYKDDVEIDGTWYFPTSYEIDCGVEYENFIYAMVDNGSGEYRFSVCSVDDDLNFNNDIVYSAPYTYNKKTTVAKATNLSYSDNIIRWSNTDSNVDHYSVAYYLTYDDKTYYQLLVSYSDGEKITVYQSDIDYFNSTINSWHNSNSNKYDKEKAKIVAAVYSVPYNRYNKEMSKSDYILLQGKKELVKVDRSSITDGKYVDAAKLVYDLGLMKNVYENPKANITKGEFCEIIVKMLGAEEQALSLKDKTSYYDDVETGTDLNGYVRYVENMGLLNTAGSSFGASTEMPYEQIIKVIVAMLGFEPYAQSYGGYPNGYLSVAARYKITNGLSIAIGGTVTREQMAVLVANAMESNTMEQTSWGYQPTYKITEESLLFKSGYSKIAGVGYADENTLTIDSGIQKDIENLTGKEVTELEFENCDYDILALNGKNSTYYVKDGKAISGFMNYVAKVQINNGEAYTSNRNITLNLEATGYTKYKIGDGAYYPVTPKVSYVLPSVKHGYQTIEVTFANADETKTKTVSAGIEFENIHKLTYMADGKVFAQFEVGCGLAPEKLYTTPNIDGYWFDGWDAVPPTVMPDEDVVINAKLSPYTKVSGILTYNGEVVSNKQVYVYDTWYTTTTDGVFTAYLAREGGRMINITYENMPKTVYVDLSDKAYDLGVVDITPTGTKADIEENTVMSVAGLEDVFTAEDKAYAESEGNSISVNVAVKSTEKTEVITEKEDETGYVAESVVDIGLIKVKKGSENTETTITETDELLEFKFAIPAESRGKASYIVLREHDGIVDMLTTVPNADGEYIVINQDVIVVYAKKFSTYGLAAKEVVSATKTDNGVSFEINLNEQVVKESALMIVKAYNKRGVQLASKTIPATSAYSGEVFLECKDAAGYKLIFWSGLDKIKPYYAVIDGSF